MKNADIALILLLLTGGFLNFLPHLSYLYPLHVDEWTHFTYAQHLSDNTPLYFGGESNSLEHGFHLLLGLLNSVGIDYLILFRFMAAFLTILIGLSIFVFCRKYFNENVGIFALLFFIFIKSSLAFLGPMFLVPLSIGLLLIPIGLVLVETNLLFLIIAGILIIHPPSGIALLFFVFSYFIFNRKRKIIFNSVLGALLSIPIFFGKLVESGAGNLEFGESIISPVFFPRILGILVILLVFLGFYLVVVKGKSFVAVYSIILFILITLYYQFNFNVLIFYERNIMYLLEIFSVPFALSLEFFYKYKKLFFILIFILLFLFIPGKIESSSLVYHIVDEEEFNEFVSYKEVEGSKAVLDPWKAIAFAPLAQKEVYSRIPPGPNPLYLERNKEIYNFFNQSCSNKTFLIENEIDIVIGC